MFSEIWQPQPMPLWVSSADNLRRRTSGAVEIFDEHPACVVASVRSTSEGPISTCGMCHNLELRNFFCTGSGKQSLIYSLISQIEKEIYRTRFNFRCRRAISFTERVSCRICSAYPKCQLWIFHSPDRIGKPNFHVFGFLMFLPSF